MSTEESITTHVLLGTPKRKWSTKIGSMTINHTTNPPNRFWRLMMLLVFGFKTEVFDEK